MVNPWMTHLSKFWAKNKKKMTYTEAMKEAAKTYKAPKVGGGKAKQKGCGIMDDPAGIKFNKKHPGLVVVKAKGRGKFDRFDRPVGTLPDVSSKRI
jgi:hypothetical protein